MERLPYGFPHEHFGVGDWIEKRIRNMRMRYVYRLVIELLVLCFVVVFFYYSLRLTLLARDVTNVFAIPKRVLYSCLPISGVIMIIYSIRNVTVEIIGMMKSQQEEGKPWFNKIEDKGESMDIRYAIHPDHMKSVGYVRNEETFSDRSAF